MSIFWVTSCGWGPDVTWLPTRFLASSLRAHWPWAPGLGTCPSGNSWAAGCQAGRTLMVLIPHCERGSNFLLSGAHVSLWPLSGMSDNLRCISRKYWHHFVTCVFPTEDLLVQWCCLREVSNTSYRGQERFYKMMGKESRGKLYTVLRSSLLSPGSECLSGDTSVSTDVHLGTPCLERLRYKQVKTQNLLWCLGSPVH